MDEINRAISSIDRDTRFRFSSLCNTLIHIAMGLVIYIVFYDTLKLVYLPSNLQLHIIFSVVGYQFLMLEAILAHAESNSWTYTMSQTLRRKIHSMMQLLGVICVIVGFAFAVSAKSSFAKHFTTGHGICGLIAFILLILTILHGIVTLVVLKFCYKISSPLGKFVHTLMGCLSTVMGLITLCVGLNNGLLGKTDSVAVATAMTAISMAYMIINPIFSLGGYLNEMMS